MCLCLSPSRYQFDPRDSPRVASMSEKTVYGRYQPTSHYQLGGRPKRHHTRERDVYGGYDSGYESIRRRESSTPPPVLVQTMPLGRIDAPPRSNTAGRRISVTRGGSGEMGYNQPKILSDGALGPIVHQGHSAAGHQMPHHTRHPPHIHSMGPRASTPRLFSITAVRQPRRYASYRDDRGGMFQDDRGYRPPSPSSSASDDSWGSERRFFPGDRMRSGGYSSNSSTTESFYISPSLRRFS